MGAMYVVQLPANVCQGSQIPVSNFPIYREHSNYVKNNMIILSKIIIMGMAMMIDELWKCHEDLLIYIDQTLHDWASIFWKAESKFK